MRRLLLLLVAAVPMLGCGDSTSPELGISGTYSLQTINQSDLPLLLYQEEGLEVRVVGGAIILDGDGTFSDRTTYEINEAGAVRNEDDIYRGDFKVVDGGAMLSPMGYQPYMVAIDGAKMWQVIGDFELAYQK